jgi:chitodextrinase
MRVKFFLSFLAVLLIAPLPYAHSAHEITLTWDNSSTPVSGYKLFTRQEGEGYDYNNAASDGPENLSIVEVSADSNWYFVVRAYDAYDESGDSNEVIYQPDTFDLDNDGLTDAEEVNTFETDPHDADTDKDGIQDGPESEYWGYNWDIDYDSDGLHNLLDNDADNDGFSDGQELDQGSDPADPNDPNLPNNPPSVPGNLQAETISATQINLSWSASTDDQAVAGYRIYRDGVEVGTSATTSYDDIGLAPVTSYSYEVSAFDTAGNESTPSEAVSATTLTENPDNPPSVPDNLTAEGVSTTQINLSWDASTDDQAVAGYKIFRDGIEIDTSTETNYADFGLTPATLYSYRVSAFDTAGNESDLSVNVSAETYTTSALTHEITLTWDSSNDPVSGYKLFSRRDNETYDYNNPAYDGSENLSKVEVNADSTWYFVVRAYTDDTESGDSNEVIYQPDSFDLDQDGLTDAVEINTFGTDPHAPDTDEDGINDGPESIYWGSNWDVDYDSDGLHNLLDSDADNDGISDGQEIEQGTDPADPADPDYPPSVPGSLQAEAVSTSRINLSWIASTDDHAVAGYRIFRNSTAIGTTTATTFEDTGLTPSTLYSYTVSAFDNAGNESIPSGAAAATTLSDIPTVPSNLQAVTVSTTQISLSWDASTDDQTVTGYRIFRDNTEIGTSATTTFHDTELTHSTLYSYAVSALDNEGNASGLSLAKSATTLTDDPPSVPINLMADTISTTLINLIWEASTDDLAVAGYRIFRDGIQIGVSTATTYEDTGLTPSTLYSYTVAAFDSVGNVSAHTGVLSVTTLPDKPSVPANLQADAISTTEINLSWNASTDDQAVTGYRIFRDDSEIAISATTTFHDTGLTHSTLYSYAVSAFDNSGNESARSQAKSATTLTDNPPSVPVNLQADTISTTRIILIWGASTDDLAVAGYRIFRDGTEIGTATATTFEDTGLTPSTDYSYSVLAFDGVGNVSDLSGSFSATTLSDKPSVPGNLQAEAISATQINLSWDASTDDQAVAGYRIFRDGTVIGTSTTTTFEDTGLTPSTNYSYSVLAFDGVGNESALSRTISGTTFPEPDTTPPSILSIVAAENKVRLLFDEGLDYLSAGNAGNYHIDSGIIILNASLESDNRTVTLTTSPHADGTYTITIEAIEDIAGNSMPLTMIDYNYMPAPAAGLMGYWKFDEGTGTTVADSSGNGNTGLLLNGPIWTLDGGIGFDGMDDYINLGTSSFDLSGALTISLWINFNDSTADSQNLIQKGMDVYPFRIQKAGLNIEAAVRTTTGIHTLTTATALNDEEWYHVVLRYTEGSIAIYINGQEDIRGTVTGTLAVDSSETAIGYGLSGDNPLSGTIDEVLIYNQALLDGEILSLYAGDQPFVDISPPSIPGNVRAEAISDTQINLLWDVSTDDQAVVGYRILRDGAEVGTSTTASYDDSGLAPDTSYSYEVSALDTAGNESTLSEAVSAETLPVDLDHPPSVPGNLIAEGISTTQIDLSWDASTDDEAVAGYKIFRDNIEIDTCTETSYEDIGLTPATLYSYAVLAFDNSGNESALSRVESTTTLPEDPDDPPSIPGNLAAKAISATQINLNWDESTDDEAVAGYRIFRDGTEIETSTIPSYEDIGLDPSTLYSYAVSAFDSAGNESLISGAVSETTLAETPGAYQLPSVEAYGKIKGGDGTHIEEVNYTFEGFSGDMELYYEVWDIDVYDEVQIILNGVEIGFAPLTGNEKWSVLQSVTLLDGLVHDSYDNYLTFKNTYNPPKTYWWGVRTVSIGQGAGGYPLPSDAAYGKIKGGDLTHIYEVNYSFAGLPGDVELYYEAWDVDVNDEVQILLNGVEIGFAPLTGNENWCETQSITLPDGLVNDSSANQVTFNNTYNPPKKYYWGIRNVSVNGP